jgi:hypothetical protein
MIQVSANVMERYAQIPGPGCWLWLGKVDAKGYGSVHIGNRYLIASRVFYTHHVGEIPAGACVCHKCDTPLCVNPDHLFLGSARDNAIDRERKRRGRFKAATPTRPGRAKYKQYDEAAA